jgi:hypothetical protein
MLINGAEQIFLSLLLIQKSQVFFYKIYLFFPLLAGGFYNFELTQNRVKTQEMAQRGVKRKYNN